MEEASYNSMATTDLEHWIDDELPKTAVESSTVGGMSYWQACEVPSYMLVATGGGGGTSNMSLSGILRHAITHS